jgi:hypothetical protein
MNNKGGIEKKAIAKAMKYERERKRKPKEIKQGKGYDILSSGRRIEVKGVGGKNPGWVTFQDGCFKALQKEKRYFVYIVTNLKAGQPELHEIKRNEIISNLRHKTTWELKLPIKEMQKWKRHLNNKRTGRKR